MGIMNLLPPRARARSATPRPPARAATGALLLAAALALGACGSEESAEQHFRQGVEHEQGGDVRAAIIEYKNALQQDPDHAEARRALGQAYLALGDGVSAEKELERARELGSQSDQLAIELMRALLLQGEFEKVVATVKEMTGRETNPALQLLLGQAQLGLGQSADARRAYEKALAMQPGLSEAHLGLARIEAQDGDLEAAQRRADLALESAADSVDGWLFKGELALAQRDYDDAVGAFERALNLKKDHAGAKIGVVRSLIAKNDYDAAARRLDPLAQAHPESPVINYLQALIARGRGDVEATEAGVREVLSVMPDHPPSLLLMGSIHYSKRKFEQAREMLSRYLAAVPGNVPARKLLGAVYLELGQPEQAVQTLAPVADTAAGDPRFLALLGSAYMRAGKVEKGTELLEQASGMAPEEAGIRTQLAVGRLASGETEEAVADLEAATALDPESVRADVALVLTHLRSREYERAVEAARRLVEKRPDNAEAHNLLAVTLEARRAPEQAREIYAKALSLDEDYAPARLNLARLDYMAGDRDSARERYERVLESAPENVQALIGLARLASEAGRAEEGLELLQRAREANPEAVQPRLVLGDYHLRRGESALALTLAKEAARIAPDNPRVMLLLARAQMATGDARQALDTVTDLTEAYPRSAAARHQLGLARARTGDADGAREAFATALSLDPGHLPAKLALGRLSASTGDPRRALELAREIQAQAPGTPQARAARVLEADALLAQREIDAALAIYRELHERSPSAALIAKMAAARRLAGDAEGAEALLRDWVAEHPEDTGVHLMLASAHHSGGDKDTARSAYERILEQQPDNVLALNNLAWLYYERDDERALDLAERAYELLPGRAEIVDTYGWLLVENERVEQGLALLQKAARQAPGNREIRYHLAVALARAGDRRAARSELEALVESGADFPQRAEAEALLEALE